MQAKKRSSPPVSLSELEGAILSELCNRGRQTAFKVRRSFAISPALEWRGSAGAVYSAIGRLEKAGLVGSEAQEDRRGSRLLFITAAGKVAMTAWSCDPVRAISVGIDPFRLRSGIWRGLPARPQRELFAQLRQAIIEDLGKLRSYVLHDDVIERASVELAIKLQETRLAWLEAPAIGAGRARGAPRLRAAASPRSTSRTTPRRTNRRRR